MQQVDIISSKVLKFLQLILQCLLHTDWNRYDCRFPAPKEHSTPTRHVHCPLSTINIKQNKCTENAGGEKDRTKQTL